MTTSPSSQPAWQARVTAGLWVLAALLTFWCFGYTAADSGDLRWNIASGRWIVENGSFPFADPWSFTREGQPWHHHQWLSGLLYWLWADLLGESSLVYWKWAILVGTFLLLTRTLQRLGSDPVSSFLSATFALAVAAPLFDLRPHLYSLLGLVLLVRLTLAREVPSLFIPLVFVVWVNLHGGYFFGLVVLPILLVPNALTGGARARWRALGLLAASVAACLVNPYGIEAFAVPLRWALDSDSPFRQLLEWRSPFERVGKVPALYPYAIGLFPAAILAVALLGFERARSSLFAVALALGLLTMAMSLTSRRFIALFAVCETLLLAPAITRILRPAIQRIPGWVPAAVAAAVGGILLSRYPVRPYVYHHLTMEHTLPVDCLNFMERNGLFGKVFAEYVWAGYLHQRSGGRWKVFIDGRADMVYDAETFRRYARVLYRQPGWSEIVDASGADYFLWPKDPGHIRALTESGRWGLVYSDAVSVLFARSDVPRPTLLESPDSPYRALTLGDSAWERGDLAEAEKQYERALALMPHFSRACFSLAVIKALRGETEKGWETHQHCQRIFPDSGARLQFAKRFHRQHDPP